MTLALVTHSLNDTLALVTLALVTLALVTLALVTLRLLSAEIKNPSWILFCSPSIHKVTPAL